MIGEDGAPDAQKLHLPWPVAGVEHSGVGFDVAPELGLDLVGAHDSPVLLGNAHVGTVHQFAQAAHPILALCELERHVQAHESLQRVHHVQHQWHDAALQLAELVDLTTERGALAFLIRGRALQIAVVAPSLIEHMQLQAVFGKQFTGCVGQGVHALLGALFGAGGGGLDIEHIANIGLAGLRRLPSCAGACYQCDHQQSSDAKPLLASAGMMGHSPYGSFSQWDANTNGCVVNKELVYTVRSGAAPVDASPLRLRRWLGGLLAVCAQVLLPATLAACGGGGGGGSPPPPPPPVQPAPPPPEPMSEVPAFVDATDTSGIEFTYGYVRPTVGSEPETFGGGAAAGDYDGDGLVDLFVVRGDIGPNLLYRNLGGNRFEELAEYAGVANTKSALENHRHSGPAFADVDGDGDLDLFVGGLEGDPAFLYRNEGNGLFTDVTADSGLRTIASRYTLSAAFGDYDLDGDLDLFLTHWGTQRVAGAAADTEHLWRNDTADGVIRFVDVSLAAGIAPDIIEPDPVGSSGDPRYDYDYTFTPSFARMDADRYPDLLIAADFKTSRYFRNNGDGTFRNATDPVQIKDRNGMGSALGDYDGDGDLDWFVTSIWSVPDADGEQRYLFGNRLYRNDEGVLVDATDGSGVHNGGWGWGACFEDFDNDGDLDIYHTNGWVEPFPPSNFDVDTSRLFIGTGAGVFADRAADAGIADAETGYGAVCADFDNDGNVDILQLHRNRQNAATLWRNEGAGGNYLRVRLRGRAPNTEAAGARIRATIGRTTQMREIILGSNFTSQNPALRIFGLGAATQVDTLEVEWPDGETTTRRNVAAGQTLEIEQPGG